VSLWKNLRGSAGEPESAPAPRPEPMAPLAATERPVEQERRPAAELRRVVEQGGESAMANIGKSISIKGDVTGDEDTVIEGRVEGRIELKNHHLTVGPNGDVTGEIGAKQVTIVGRVNGNITAIERVEICDSGRLDGDVIAPRLLIQEGAQVNGNISMRAPQAGAQPGKKPEQTRQGNAQVAPQANV
jgi:cytoskeletal protein CcmA (bactofilin family)